MARDDTGWKIYKSRLPQRPRAVRGLTIRAVREGHSEVKRTVQILRTDLGERPTQGVADVLLAELAAAPEQARRVSAEAEAFAHLLAATRALSHSRNTVALAANSLAIFSHGSFDAEIATALDAFEREAARRAALPMHERLADGASVPRQGRDPVQQWIVTRSIDLGVGPAELTIAEAILVAERVIDLPQGATWWHAPSQALQRWTTAFLDVLQPVVQDQ